MKPLLLIMMALVLMIGTATASPGGGQKYSPTRDQVQQTYLSQVGVREATGHNDGIQVEKYLASTGLNQGYAWCAAFVNWTLEQNDIEGPQKAAWSPSWFPKTRIVQKDKAQKGDVFGIYFRSKGRIAHVGFIDRYQGKTVMTVEGNTNDAGSREGDGVYRKRRLTRQIYRVADWIAPPNRKTSMLTNQKPFKIPLNHEYKTVATGRIHSPGLCAGIRVRHLFLC
jgi:hypothetical protein